LFLTNGYPVKGENMETNVLIAVLFVIAVSVGVACSSKSKKSKKYLLID